MSDDGIARLVSKEPNTLSCECGQIFKTKKKHNKIPNIKEKKINKQIKKKSYLQLQWCESNQKNK
jgi:hypothetical protein